MADNSTTQYPIYDKRHLDIIYAHAENKVSKKIASITLVRHDGELYGNGDGHIDSNQDGSLTITIDNCDFNTFRVPGFLPERSGAYIKDEDKLIATGALDDGLTFTTSPLHISCSGSVLKLDPRNISFVSNNDTENHLYSRLSLTTRKDGFISPNINIHENLEVEFKLNIPTSFGRFDLTNGSYEVRGRDGHFYLYTHITCKTKEEQQRLEDSLLLSMSFALGNKIHSRAVYETG